MGLYGFGVKLWDEVMRLQCLINTNKEGYSRYPTTSKQSICL